MKMKNIVMMIGLFVFTGCFSEDIDEKEVVKKTFEEKCFEKYYMRLKNEDFTKEQALERCKNPQIFIEEAKKKMQELDERFGK